jgi:DNA invertase Pin-like site-specific DNA recombinase
MVDRENSMPKPATVQVPTDGKHGRILAYCRVSTDAQAEDGQSLDVQQRQFEGWAMQRGQQPDDVSGNGIARLFLTIVSAFAEFERDRIGERIRATKRAQKARGEYLGGKPPFGYAYDADRKLVPVPEQQKELRRISTLHAKGLSPYKISDDLAKRAVKLSHVTIRKIIAGRVAE